MFASAFRRVVRAASLHWESDLEQVFCTQSALSLESFRGAATDVDLRYAFRKDPYQLFSGNARSGRARASTKAPVISALSIRAPHRFSNSLIQLANAVEFAETNEIPTVYAPGFWYLRSGTSSGGVNIRTGELPFMHRERLVLDGYYYYRATLGPLYGPHKRRSDTLRSVANLIRIQEPSADFDVGTVVIHIRSGDIFRGAGAHPDYGQPPLSFYQSVLASIACAKVVVVAEDDANPVIKPLLEYLRQSGSFKVESRIGGKLHDDIGTLLKAETLIAGSGTFCEGVSALSRRLKRVITFEREFDTWGRDDVLVDVVKDRLGAYRDFIYSGNWVNAENQRALMCSYPASALAISGI
ncbi:hypothetical protein [Paraburkholderia phenazinium]|jgi:hypothetical protein|uniref:Uncharacterized protein n=1 Tax=Paraburkholderia phenazinium TaxID=60549 RepID=A0A1G7S865_9BURK|nr:hypothetical protein [Paraburkholderia phenazinium]SDG18639.1 hypothetical protein SAMN05216466_102404 [Paraburkholderia phenazinium]